MNEIHEVNRKLWNSWADWWQQRSDDEGLWAECHRQPGLVLSPQERHLLHDLSDKAVCVLGSGDNKVVFALSGMGAKVTSVDISERQLEIAQARAQSLGLDISFVRADVVDLAPLGDAGFDVVYTGGHVSVWVSDIKSYYAEAVRVLKHGALFLVNEYHPFRRVYEEETEHPIIRYVYSKRGPYEYLSDEGRPQIEFHWTVADHIQAVLDAGCELLKVEEHGSGRDFWRKADLTRLPQYLLIAGRRRLPKASRNTN
jgi:ubiquinone/menaquinone biosynthesis C-methylase UbiE